MSIINNVKDKLEGNSTPSGQHLAAIVPSKGSSALEVVHRQTPTPGPNELLIEVKSIALNPVDWNQRDYDLFLTSYPAVLGSDIAGIVVSAGSSVASASFKPGTRVFAFASAFYRQGNPDYGALQTRVLVPAEYAAPLPQGMSFNEGSLLPMSVLVAWAGWYSIGVSRDTAYTPADKKGFLVWGGASSIGSGAVQLAKSMGFVVYATASEKHHDYLKGLGASKLFDYKGEHVVESIVKAAKEDGVTIQLGFDAVGQLKLSIEVLKELKGEGTAKLASAVPLNMVEFAPVEGIEVKFISPPADEQERTEFMSFIFGVWLIEKLQKGEFVPSPTIQVIEGGLESANKGLDELKKGVSGVKLVLEV